MGDSLRTLASSGLSCFHWRVRVNRSFEKNFQNRAQSNQYFSEGLIELGENMRVLPVFNDSLFQTFQFRSCF